MYVAIIIGISLIGFYGGIFYAIWRAHRKSKLRQFMKGGPDLSFGQIINEPKQAKVTKFSHEKPEISFIDYSGL